MYLSSRHGCVSSLLCHRLWHCRHRWCCSHRWCCHRRWHCHHCHCRALSSLVIINNNITYQCIRKTLVLSFGSLSLENTSLGTCQNHTEAEIPKCGRDAEKCGKISGRQKGCGFNLCVAPSPRNQVSRISDGAEKGLRIIKD